MWDFLVKGGLVMIPIGICSVVALTIFLERLWMLRRKSVTPAALLIELQQLVSRGKWEEARQLCRADKSLVAAAIGAGLEHKECMNNRGGFREAVEEGGERAVKRLYHYLNVLGTIATIAPLLGLLGTVSGMIKIFHVLAEQGVGNAGALAGGISEALITTEAGLIVAIPTWVAYRYCLSKAQGLTHEMEVYAGKVVDIVEGAGPSAQTSGRIGRPQFEGA